MEIMSSSAVAPVATGDTTEVPGDQPAAKRPRLYLEILLIALCYSAYSLVRNLVPTTHTEALRLGHQILDLEGFLHLWALNRGVLLTPFHNMALFSPAHTEADVDRHTEVFGEAVRALVG